MKSGGYSCVLGKSRGGESEGGGRLRLFLSQYGSICLFDFLVFAVLDKVFCLSVALVCVVEGLVLCAFDTCAEWLNFIP